MPTDVAAQSNWATVLAAAVPAVGAFFTYLVGRSHGEGKSDERVDKLVKDVGGILETLKDHTELLTRHTTLHEGYVSMQVDIRSTRDCVNQIAGKLGIQGPK